MALIFGSPKRQGAPKEDIKNDQRLKLAKDMYMAGKMKLMTTETIPVVKSSPHSADSLPQLHVRQRLLRPYGTSRGRQCGCHHRLPRIRFIPSRGDKYYSCYGTAVRMKKLK